MWRLILVTFAFMGWAFYELSGGADYAPAAGSRQHASAQEIAQPKPRATRSVAPAFAAIVPAGTREAGVILASAPARDPGAPVSDAEKRLRLTLDAARQGGDGIVTRADSAAGVATIAADPDKMARLVAAAGAVRPTGQPQAETPVVAADTADGGRLDRRLVAPSRVNMRQGPGTDFSVVAKLTQGTEVEVLRDEGDGWVKLRVVETGRVGWMADRLLVAAN